jgi:hypothetical protein
MLIKKRQQPLRHPSQFSSLISRRKPTESRWICAFAALVASPLGAQSPESPPSVYNEAVVALRNNNCPVAVERLNRYRSLVGSSISASLDEAITKQISVCAPRLGASRSLIASGVKMVPSPVECTLPDC